MTDDELAEVERLRAENHHHRVTAMNSVSKTLYEAAIAEKDAEIERLRAELYEEQLTVATVVSLKAMEKRLEKENDVLRRQARKASRSRDAVVRMRERLLAEVERLTADAAALREALLAIVSRHVHENNSHHPEWIAARTALARAGGAS